MREDHPGPGAGRGPPRRPRLRSGNRVGQVLAQVPDADKFFWGTHAGAELDLLLIHRGRRFGVEFKYSDAPGMTRSLHIALADLHLERAFVVHPGRASYAVHPKVDVVPLAGFGERFSPVSARKRGPRSGVVRGRGSADP